MTAPPVLVIAGPTAVGKSSLALRLASEVDAEIISADSRQVYRQLDIGTAKPSLAERNSVPHWGLDLLDPGQRFSAGQFLEWATESITDISARNHPVIIVGGSTLYVHALVEGLPNVPSVPVDVEQSLLRQASTSEGAGELYSELLASDPEAAATLDPTKTHRLVRWVGVLRTTDRLPSDWWRETNQPVAPTRLVILTLPRDVLYSRIEGRVDQMVQEGLVAEVEAVLATSNSARSSLEATIGYRELLPYLDGQYDLDEAIRLIKRNSRRYAKRQLTWYRRYDDALWLDSSLTDASALLDAIAPWPA